MKSYLVQRVLQGFLVLFAVFTLVFILVRLTGDPVHALLPAEVPDEIVREFRQSLGLDRSLPEQYLLAAGQIVRGDFGNSYRYRRPALELVVERFPTTLQLAFSAFAVSLCIAIPAGIASAARPNTLIDHISRLLALFGQSMPAFWLGIVLIFVVSVELGWLPTSGSGSWQHIILPATTVGFFSAALTARLLRSSILEAASKDFTRTARSKGLAERTVLTRHVLRNAMLPVITVLGLQLGGMLGGTIITETVFAYPGVGLLVIQSIQARDFPVVQAFTMVIAAILTVINFTVDLAYAYLDPRVKYG